VAVGFHRSVEARITKLKVAYPTTVGDRNISLASFASLVTDTTAIEIAIPTVIGL